MAFWAKFLVVSLFDFFFGMGCETLFLAPVISEYVPLWLRFPPKTMNQTHAFGALFLFLPQQLLVVPAIERLKYNGPRLEQLVRRYCSIPFPAACRALLLSECCYVVAHVLVARGDPVRVAVVSGLCTMAVSAFKLVAAYRDSCLVALFFLVNSTVAGAIILVQNGGLCAAAIAAFSPALPAIFALCIKIDKLYGVFPYDQERIYPKESIILRAKEE